ncbi:precorrin-6A/cobalt-precorrin-6A reductase [Aestuariirhabdus haliotis]|uniref:precorrin-6A/cobalt-precorrin-6A reductase n=1 Tax=Aestuariirhabdus haliotis TaxID=2918751 RepID=UPI0020BF45E8|nr:precorrin-6A/cobalt-precorrin-6A reductase [Aestuariirhabdus haliotis]MCL6420615.1 precorrin-6A/cobalt-precorrin-6A reductase [Aestuariirhabdus haliotis]
MKILLLGGINEAKKLAGQLHRLGHQVTYSVAGLVRQPFLECPVISGGFSQYCKNEQPSSDSSGIEGLISWLGQQAIELVIDATHPYAEQISKHAVIASDRLGLPCWRYQRPAWQSSYEMPFDEVANWHSLSFTLPHYRRPLFAVGQIPPKRLDIAEHQQWLVRSAVPISHRHPRLTTITAIGPFSIAHEEQMLRLHRADLLIAKNSGGSTMNNKLAAANRLNIPVTLLQRPRLKSADREFSDLESLISALPNRVC